MCNYDDASNKEIIFNDMKHLILKFCDEIIMLLNMILNFYIIKYYSIMIIFIYFII